MATKWNIEEELTSLTDADSTEQAIYRLGINVDLSKELAINEIRDWYRSGAETYLYTFSIKSGGTTIPLVIKACISGIGTESINKTVLDWIAKRREASLSDIETPRLYYGGKGVIIEEYIPKTLTESISQGLVSRHDVCAFAEKTKLFCAKHGLNPLRILTDLRSRGSDIVMVDFGWDLGNIGSVFNEASFDQTIEKELTSIFRP